MPGIDKKLKKVNPRKTITNKQSGIDGPSRTVKKYDASDFSTNKKSTKKDMLAIKANPKKSVKGMKNTFKDDTTAKRTPKKDTSDFASSNKPKVALPKSRPSSVKPKVKVKTPKNVSQGSTMSKKTVVKTPKNVSQDSTISKKTSKKKPSFFEKIMSETKRNFSGDIKKGTGRYKSLSTGKTNFNKKKKKLAKQISV